MPVAAEQSLPASIDRLYTAVGRLVDDAKELTRGELRSAPSLYQQLCDQIPARARGGV
jgi:hypothetical protein